MSTVSDTIVLLAVKRNVIAFNKTDGTRVWSTKLASALGDDFVTILADTTQVYAHTRGEMYCLDLATGAILWQDGLSGMGYGIASIALPGGASSSPPIAARIKHDQQAGATAASSSSS